jgi:hypothetical protein
MNPEDLRNPTEIIAEIKEYFTARDVQDIGVVPPSEFLKKLRKSGVDLSHGAICYINEHTTQGVNYRYI